MKKIALIACSAKKLKESVKNPSKKFKAQEFYKGNTFKISKDYCFDSENGTFINGFDDFCILSAKYGLLEKDDEISCYNMYLGKQTKQHKTNWAKTVLAALAAKYDLKNDEFYIFGGTSYYEGLIHHLNCVVFKYKNSNCIDLNKIKAEYKNGGK